MNSLVSLYVIFANRFYVRIFSILLVCFYNTVFKFEDRAVRDRVNGLFLLRSQALYDGFRVVSVNIKQFFKLNDRVALQANVQS